jgi:hypothetical protein
MKARQFAAVAALALLPRFAEAQATVDVRLGDQATTRLERLVSLGLVDTGLVGQRPYTRRAAARIVAQARAAIEKGVVHPPVAAGLIAALERELREPEKTQLLERVGARVQATNSPPFMMADDLLGTSEAWLNPILPATGSDPIDDGAHLVIESAHTIRGASWLVADLRPRLVTSRRSPEGPDRARHLEADVAYLRAAAGSFLLDVGRANVAFGHGAFGTLGVSDQAPPMLMVRVANDVPISIPWVSRISGPVRGTLFVADLGADQNFPHARLGGWKASFLPHPRLELGVTVLSQQGGGGAPPASFAVRVIDLLPLYDAIFVTDRDFQISNKFSGIDFRFRPAWAGVELHGELLLDDWDERRVRSTLWEDAGYVLGASLPVISPDGSVTLAVEAHHVGIRMYRHSQFTSGYTTRGRLIGDPLGSNANAFYARLRRDRGMGAVWEVDGAWEFRSGKRYASSGGIGEQTLHFHEIERLPHEYRRRLVGRRIGETRDRAPLGRDLRTRAEAGVEFVRNEAHGTESRWNFMARLGAEIVF